MHSRRDARDLRSGQEPDSSEGRGRKEVKTLAQLRRRRLPSRGSGWPLPLDVYFRDDVLAVRLRFVPSHSRSPLPRFRLGRHSCSLILPLADRFKEAMNKHSSPCK